MSRTQKVIDASEKALVELEKVIRQEINLKELDPEKAKDKLIKVGFNITDQNTTYSVVIRNQIAEISTSYDDSYDIIVSVDSNTWKGMVLKTINPLAAFASGKITVSGNQLQFIEFSNMFSN